MYQFINFSINQGHQVYVRKTGRNQHFISATYTIYSETRLNVGYVARLYFRNSFHKLQKDICSFMLAHSAAQLLKLMKQIPRSCQHKLCIKSRSPEIPQPKLYPSDLQWRINILSQEDRQILLCKNRRFISTISLFKFLLQVDIDVGTLIIRSRPSHMEISFISWKREELLH